MREPRRPCGTLVALGALLLGAWVSPACQETPTDALAKSAPPPGGVVVESVEEGGVAHRAGLQAGDVVLSWARPEVAKPSAGGARGELTAPFDWYDLEDEQAPRGPVQVAGLRAGVPFTVTLVADGFRTQVRCPLPPADAAAFQAALESLSGGEPTTGAAAVREIARRLERRGERENGAHLLFRAAARLSSHGQMQAGEQLYREAGRTCAEGCTGSTGAWLGFNLGENLAAQRRPDEALAVHEEVLAEREALGQALLVAHSLNRIGALYFAKGALDEAEGRWRRALEIREALSPGSALVAASLNNLGLVAKTRGDLALAESLLGRATAISERLAPDSPLLASGYGNLGNLLFARGDLGGAEARYRAALAIRERQGPASRDLANTLNSLGAVSQQRGDLAEAEAWFRKALALTEQVAPDSVDLARVYLNLGSVAWLRGDLTAADAWHRRSLAIKERVAPGTVTVANSYDHMGMVAHARGDQVAAEQWYRRALEIHERTAPGSLLVSVALGQLGQVAEARGAPDEAEGLFRRALDIQGRVAPGSLSEAATRRNLGGLALKRGAYGEAARLYSQALAIHRQRSPGSADHCNAAWNLARLARMENRDSEALAFYAEALEALERQQARLGGSPDTLAAFREQYLDLYHDYAALLLKLGREAEAFRVLESSRARALLALLAERELVARDVPEALDRERRIMGAEYARAMDRLAQLPEAESSEAARSEVERTLTGLRLQQDDLRARIKAASPRLASLRYPEPLDLAAIQRCLPPGTLLLAWMLGEKNTLLFSVSPEAYEVYEVALEERAVQQRLRRLRSLMQDPASDPAAVREAGAALAPLLAPAAREIARARRLILSPEGALWLCPFSALPDPNRPSRVLAQDRPISVISSATVLAQLQGPRARVEPPEPWPDGVEATVFGDPVYPDASGAAVQRSEVQLAPLPGSRLEAETLRKLYGDKARTYLGAEATERRLRQQEHGSVLHLAAHGLVDERFPMESAIALTLPGTEVDLTRQDPATDGYLRVWELFEGLTFEFDLVTLSACETALGKDVAGEGVLGLSRAFHYAGARSVLMTLWGVSDASTAVFMERFYRRLRAGDPKDVALQKAQRALRKDPRTAHPFHWAPFLLSGAN